MKCRMVGLAGLVACGLAGGCLSIHTPESVTVSAHRDYHGEDAAAADRRMPETHSQEECRDALHRAYEENSALQREISWRDKQIRHLQDDLRDAKADRDKYKQRYEGAKHG